MRITLFAITTLSIALSACNPSSSQDSASATPMPAEPAAPAVDGAAGATASYEALCR